MSEIVTIVNDLKRLMVSRVDLGQIRNVLVRILVCGFVNFFGNVVGQLLRIQFQNGRLQSENCRSLVTDMSLWRRS